MAVLPGISSEMQTELPLASQNITVAFLVRPAESTRAGERLSLEGSGEPRTQTEEPGNEEEVQPVTEGRAGPAGLQSSRQTLLLFSRFWSFLMFPSCCPCEYSENSDLSRPLENF